MLCSAPLLGPPPLQVAQIADVTPIAYGAFLVLFLVIASATVRLDFPVFGVCTIPNGLLTPCSHRRPVRDLHQDQADLSAGRLP
jgi:hypothetical protein